MAAEQAPQIRTELLLNPDNPREREIMIVEREFALQQRKARAYSESDIVPERYRGNIANVMIAMEIANRMRTGLIQIMQSLYVVHGMPAFEAKYMIAMINSSGILTGRLKYIFSGEKNSDGYGCHAEGIEAATGEKLTGPRIDMAMVKAEGWLKNTKWTSLRDLMFTYRAAAFWCRTNSPELLLGMRTVDEVEDIVMEREINPSFTATTKPSNVQDMLDAKKAKAVDKEQPAVIDGEKVDMSTGEKIASNASTVPESEKPSKKEELQESGPIAIKMADVQSSLETAKTIDELNEAADLIRNVPNKAHRDLLNGLYDKRTTELNGELPL